MKSRCTFHRWYIYILQHPYYKRLRKIADELEFRGPILWTELVKCQSKENGQLSVQTIRDDINKYLFKELEVIPADWPLFGIGGKAFEILSYRFPDRLVLGVPHPTGSYGLFPKLFENQKLKQDIYNRIQEIIKVKRAESLVIEHPYTVRPTQTVQEVKDLQRERNVSGFLVVNELQQLIGIISARDLLFAKETDQVQEIMTQQQEGISRVIRLG